MGGQLDILALEPFYGGARRAMLETVIHHSRHRWTLLKLPPRRIERRLQAAAHWFAEQLSRHWAGRIDLCFTSEAMNLADLFQLMPSLAPKPTVVYFHDNQLPPPDIDDDTPLDLVNLNTAQAASEIWFNSLFHLKLFHARASAMVRRHSELSTRDPMPLIMNKAHVLPPPLDLELVGAGPEAPAAARDARSLFVDTRGADMAVMNEAFARLTRGKQAFTIVSVGPVAELSPEVRRRAISEADDRAQFQAMHQCGLFISTKPQCAHDHHAVRAMAAGCWPVLPRDGSYPELLPRELHERCLYDGSAEQLAERIVEGWALERPDHYALSIKRAIEQFNAVAACKVLDERFEQLVAEHPPSKQRKLKE